MRFSRFPLSACVTASAVTLLFALAAAVPRTAFAQVVVPNSLAAVEGNDGRSTLDNTDARTYQTQIAASQLTGFAIGSQIGGISYRLDNNSTAPAANLTFASYQVTLSQAANTIGNFSTNFASNIGANSALVYNGALTFTAASYSAGATGTTPNAFGPTVTFASGYTYQGGDLVITIRHSGNGSGNSPGLDSTSSAAQGYGTAIVGEFSTTGQNATTADSNATGVAAVLRLNAGVAAGAPEPSTLPLVGMGIIGGMGTLTVARRRKAKATLSVK